MTVKLFKPETDEPQPLGRVWTEGDGAAEYVWMGRSWQSDADPTTAAHLTLARIGWDIDSVQPNAMEDVLKSVADTLNGKYELSQPVEEPTGNVIY